MTNLAVAGLCHQLIVIIPTGHHNVIRKKSTVVTLHVVIPMLAVTITPPVATCIVMQDSHRVIHTEQSIHATYPLVHLVRNQLVADQTISQIILIPVNHQEALAVVTGSVSFKTMTHHTHHILELRIGIPSPTKHHQQRRKENQLDQLDANGDMKMVLTMFTMKMAVYLQPITSVMRRYLSSRTTKTNTTRCPRNKLVAGTTTSHKTMFA